MRKDFKNIIKRKESFKRSSERKLLEHLAPPSAQDCLNQQLDLPYTSLSFSYQALFEKNDTRVRLFHVIHKKKTQANLTGTALTVRTLTKRFDDTISTFFVVFFFFHGASDLKISYIIPPHPWLLGLISHFKHT